MSPRSRGRPLHRGHGGKRPVAVRHLHPADHVLREAGALSDSADRLTVETLASEWLGRAWGAANMSERTPEKDLILAVLGRAGSRPTAHRLAAVMALRTVAPPDARTALDESLGNLGAQLPMPRWAQDPGWRAVRARRDIDPWDSQRALKVLYDGPQPHVLIVPTVAVGGRFVAGIFVVEEGLFDRPEAGPDEVLMSSADAAPDEVLAELAESLLYTDLLWPRHDEPEYAALRALAWARCRDFAREGSDWEPLGDEDRANLIAEFTARVGVPGDDVVASLADVFLDYGDGYIPAGPLAWSPRHVGIFLVDWLPRKALLDRKQRAALPDTLRRWVRFALERRGVDLKWIDPVVSAVSEYEAEFEAMYDDEASWGPARQLVTALEERGVDLTDRAAVNDAIQAYNAEQLARRLLDEGN